jgi:arylsulfatase A-like enzyme
MPNEKLNRRTFLSSTVGGFLAWELAMKKAISAEEKPNIIVIIVDDMGYADVGFNGCQDIPTPNIDSIAQNGVRFTNAYVSHPFCAPTRAGILTGRYQQRFGFEYNPRFDFKDEISGLPEGEITLAQILRGAGYYCGLIGKWHLGAHEKFHPLKKGFDEFFGFRGGGHDYFKSHEKLDAPMYQLPLEDGYGKWLPLKGYLTFLLAEEAVRFIKRNCNRRFFLYLAFNAPHTPLQAPEEYVQKFSHIDDKRRKMYAAMVSALDDAIGEVLKTLREENLEEKTLIFFISDNGGPVGAASNGSSNGPLRDGKGSLYEGGIRVPFAIQWKGKLPSGKVYTKTVISLDIFSTAIAAAGIVPPKDRKIDGVNLLPYLTADQEKQPHEYLFWRVGGGKWLAIRDERFKLHKKGDSVELYDLQDDVGEQNNLASKLPKIVQRLSEVLDGWNSELKSPVFPPPQKGEAT